MVNVRGVDCPTIVQLYKAENGKSENGKRTYNVVQSKVVEQDGEVVFPLLPEGKYCVRAILDRNGNGVWDTGLYLKHRQPEEIVYLRGEIAVKQNFDVEQIDEMDKWEGSQLNKAKEILAYELTSLVHGEEEAKKAEASAKALFGGGSGSSEDMPTTEIGEDELTDGAMDILSILVRTGLCSSKSDARRNVQQGGVTVDESFPKEQDATCFTVRASNCVHRPHPLRSRSPAHSLFAGETR